VVSLRLFDFDGHVYNLTTEHGYFTIDGLYTGNTVFRTNVMSAYGAGKHRALSDPDVIAARPYRQIRTAGDARVRDEHAQLEGLTYMADGPLSELKTPFGFQCRCSVVSLAEYSGEVVSELPAGSVDPGFG
jgi:hypothetical protein